MSGDGGQTQSGGQKQTPASEQVAAEQQDAAVADVAERHEKLSEDVDAILDEIDDLLEENAETFVMGFVQKGGQ